MRAARAGGCALEGYEKAVRYNLLFQLQTSHKMALLPLLLALKALTGANVPGLSTTISLCVKRCRLP